MFYLDMCKYWFLLTDETFKTQISTVNADVLNVINTSI